MWPIQRFISCSFAAYLKPERAERAASQFGNHETLAHQQFL